MASTMQPGQFTSHFGDLQRSWKWFLALTLILVVLTTASLDLPIAWTLLAVTLLGCLLVVAGILGAIFGFWWRRWFALPSGFLAAGVGCLMVVNPLVLGVVLTVVIAAGLMIVGAGRSVLPVSVRAHRWGWLLVNSILTLLLGMVIWQGWAWWLPTFITLSLAGATTDPLGPGDYTRSLPVGGQTRSYLVHVPPTYDPLRPTPVVLAFHGASMDGPLMAVFCGLNPTADQHGFVVVYPNGTRRGYFRFWDASGLQPGVEGEDVAFVRHLLDDLKTLVTVDPKRVYACGMSDGGMMCYRLAATCSDGIAAFAPVGGSILTPAEEPQRPVPLIHFHGTADSIIPFAGWRPVEESIQTWARLNGCPVTRCSTDQLTQADADLAVTQTTYGPGRGGAEVVLVVIEGGGHTWPGRKPLVGFLGKSARTISANERMWEFFQRHLKRN